MKKVVKRIALFSLLTIFTLILSGCKLNLGLIVDAIEDVVGSTIVERKEPHSDVNTTTGDYCKISFMLEDDLMQENSVEKGTYINEPKMPLDDTAKYDYTFIGWDANGDGIKEEFPYQINEDTTFTLLYTQVINTYHYDIYVKGELVCSETKEYGSTIEYPTVNSEIINEEVFIFLGWKYDGVFDGYTKLEVTKNVRIDAYYADSQVLKLYYDSVIYASYINKGTTINYSSITNVAAPEGKVIRWYVDNEYKQLFTSNIMPDGNLTLYGRAEYINESDAGIQVQTKEELLSYFNVMLINRETTQKFNVQFEYESVNSLSTYLVNNSYSEHNYSVSTSMYGTEFTFNITYAPIATRPSPGCELTQMNSFNVGDFVSNRDQYFNSFKIEQVANTFVVKNSEALYYALEHGYKPIIDSTNEDLLFIYSEMKETLRKIVDDSMDDYTKVRKIYEFLVMNITYDNAVMELALSSQENMGEYCAFYLEGVFKDHLAVCDGIAKAFVCLCQIEGINAVRITGETVDSVNHAWNKVCVNDIWYVVDATSGGVVVDDTELFTYSYLFLTDSEYASHATSDLTKYSEITCTTTYDLYSTLTIKVNFINKSIKATSILDAATLLKAFYNDSQNQNSCFDMELGYSFTNISNELQNIINVAHITKQVSFIANGSKVTFIYK